jgi:NitT/TauT family transport system permease protein
MRVLPPAVLLGLLALGWQLYAQGHQFLVPTLGGIWHQLYRHPGEYLDAAAVTLKECGIGLGVSGAVAFGLAVAMSHVPLVERAVMPLAVVLNVTPVVSFTPGLALAFGLGSSLPRYIVTAIIVFFPILVNSLVGLQSADPEAVQYFASLDASRREVLFHLRLPSSLPFLFAAARISFPLAVIGAVVAEFSTSGPQGLGTIIANGQISLVAAQIWAAILCLAVMGVAFTVLVTGLERQVLSWRPAPAPARR